MIKYNEIKEVHLEISTLCNASCPLCPRNFRGYPFNDGYPEINLTLKNAQHIFTSDLLNQLTRIRINGNYGDIVMNPEGADIVEYFKHHNHKLEIHVTTNGSARDKTFWERLATSGAVVFFDLDGLEDTHHLYRQNTIWSTVIKNATSFISAGGYAVWKMIKFDHNKHQISECKKLSNSLGFKQFIVNDHGRDTGPVYNKHGKLTHILGNYTGETNFKKLYFRKRTDTVLLEDIIDSKIPKSCITCETSQQKSIYIAANGEVSPCCFTGFYPASYGSGEYLQAINHQLKPLIYKNNALEYPLDQCIEWFSGIETSWGIKNYNDGRLVVCDDSCGFH